MISVQSMFEGTIAKAMQALYAKDTLVSRKTADLLGCNVCSGSQVAMWAAVALCLAVASIPWWAAVLATINAVGVNMILQDLL